MPTIDKPTGTTSAQRVSTTQTATAEQQLLTALQGGADKANLPPAQAEKALQIVKAMIDRMGGVPTELTGSQRADVIVKTWSEDWSQHVPTMTPQEHARLATEYPSRIQKRQQEIAPNGDVKRTLHRKGVFATTEAKFTPSPDLPAELRHGPFAGGDLRAIVRLSNASGKSQDDNDFACSRSCARC
jgi:hypothetical protein